MYIQKQYDIWYSIRIYAIEQLDFAGRPRRMISAIEITVAKIQPGQSRWEVPMCS